jgi:hypothetical protein
VAVVFLGDVGIDDHSPILSRHQRRAIVAVVQQGSDNAFDLPGGARTGGVPGLPRGVDLQDGLAVHGQGCLIAGEVHQPGVVVKHGLGAGPENRDLATAGKSLVYHRIFLQRSSTARRRFNVPDAG